MNKLFIKPGACSLAAHILLEEAGLPFELDFVRAGDEEARERLLRYNPLGQVATLVVEDDQPLTQNAAIFTWISDKVPEKAFFPAAGTLERARAYEWISYLGTTLHTSYSPLFAPGKFVRDESRFDEVRSIALEKVQGCLAYIESRLGEGPFVLGSEFSAVDPYLFVMFSWTQPMQIDRAPYPKLQKHAEMMLARPATQRAMKAEGL